MKDNTNKKTSDKNLVENDPLAIRNIMDQGKYSTKNQLRRETVPHIRPHIVNGKKFYYHVDGSGPEKYLGDADYILRAVTMYRETTRKKQ